MATTGHENEAVTVSGLKASLQKYKTDVTDVHNLHYLAMTGTAAKTTTPYYAAQWNGTDATITSLYTGLTVQVKVPVAGNGTYGTVLDVNGLGQHPVCANVNTMVSTRYAVGCIVILIYDAEQTATAYINSASASTITGVWKIAEYDSNSDTVPQGYCGTAAATAAKEVTCTNYSLLDKSYLMVNVRYSNTYVGKITLNVNSAGAKDIYINGEVSSALNYTLPAGSYITYYEDNKFYFRTDGKITGDLFGTALNVIGSAEKEDAFLYRPTGGHLDTYSDKASLNSIKGNTVAWNQLVQNGNFADFSNWSKSSCQNTVSNNVCTFTATNKNCRIYQNIGNVLVSGHKYYLSVYIKPTTVNTGLTFFVGKSNSLTYQGFNIRTGTLLNETSVFTKVAAVKTLSESPSESSYVCIMDLRDSDWDAIQFKNVQVVDLTLMFGEGNEPSTVEEFEAWLAQNVGLRDYYPYNAGELIPVRMAGIKTVGFNQWDEEWELGAIDGGTGGNVTTSARIRTKNYVPVLPNTKYYIKTGDVVQAMTVAYYDSEKIFISASWPSANFTTPSNARYVRIGFSANYGQPYNHDICINLSWSGKRNGEYEPYWTSTKNLDVTKIYGKVNGAGDYVQCFPDGMRSAGTAHDELSVSGGVTKAVKNVGDVDLGTKTWTKSNSSVFSAGYFFVSYYIPDMLVMTNNNNLACAQYEKTNAARPKDKGFASYDNTIRVYDSSYSDASTFKTAMNGVMLYYELASPVTYTDLVYRDNGTDTPFTLPTDYKVDDFGTEEIIVPEPVSDELTSSAPVLNVTYDLNSKDTVRNLPKNYVSATEQQSFSDTEKALARQNIGAAGQGDIVTYESKTAASGGTDLSLVTTGEKYTWNGKVGSVSIGTSGNSITLTKDGSTSSITAPYAEKAKKDADGNVISSTYINYGAMLQSNNSFAIKNKLYITKTDNALYGADKRFVVTHKYYSAADDSLLGTLATDKIFNGNYEVAIQHPKEGEYGEVYIGITEEANLTSTSTYMWTYGNGTILINFYYGMVSPSVSCKVYCRASTNTTEGWYEKTVTLKSTNVYAVDIGVTAGGTCLSAIKITYGGTGTGTYGASLCEIEMYRTRVSIGEQPVVTKYPVPQVLLGKVTAPKFITKNGTSSQFVKGDGSLDGTTYGTYSKPATGIPASDMEESLLLIHPVDLPSQDAGHQFSVGDDVVVNGRVYRCTQATAEPPITLITQNGKLVYSETNGERAYMTASDTLNAGWQEVIDVSDRYHTDAQAEELRQMVEREVGTLSENTAHEIETLQGQQDALSGRLERRTDILGVEYVIGSYWNTETDHAVATSHSSYARSEPIPIDHDATYHIHIYEGSGSKENCVTLTDGSLLITRKIEGTSSNFNNVTLTPEDTEGATYLLLGSHKDYILHTVVRCNRAVDVQERVAMMEGGMYGFRGKYVAIIGDSISTNGNWSEANPLGNVPEIVVQAADVGVTLSAYATYYDIGTTVGGHQIVAADVGTEITFTPVTNDVGKAVGVPNNYNAAGCEVWWEAAARELGFNPIPVCWSGSSMSSHEGTDNIRKTSYAWHDAQIRKCGIRTPGTMTRKAPDMVIVYRGTNDFSHSPFSKLTDGYFGGASWDYPSTDAVTGGYGFKEATALTVKKLREAYPEARIVLCTMNHFKRLSSTYPGFPTRNGQNTLMEYNNAIREAADWLGCGLIEFDKDGITHANAISGGYYQEGTGADSTHPNGKGHRVLAAKAMRDLIAQTNSMV